MTNRGYYLCYGCGKHLRPYKGIKAIPHTVNKNQVYFCEECNKDFWRMR